MPNPLRIGSIDSFSFMRAQQAQRWVNVDVPTGMTESLNLEVIKMGVTRRSV